ncbi:MAG: DUF948 domain-containing protein [Thermodesulfovibrionales bacterium]|nr:DUF948 domain-containing protein [Thermodesulfovibrionales bacterium]
MANQTLLIIISAGFFVIILIFLLAIGFLIYAILELKKISQNLKTFFIQTEERLNPVLSETELTLKSIRKVTDDLGEVSGSIKEVSKSINEITTNLNTLSLLINELRVSILKRTLALRVGFREALTTFIKQLKERR